MSVWMAGAAVVSVGAGIYSANKQSSAAKSAAQAQTDSAQAGIEEQRRQFDKVQELLAPFVNAGTSALSGQKDLLGTNGAAAQQSAIDALQASPQFQTLTQQGEEAILANASATGGLRGGNVQGSLAQFRPQVLSQLIEQQYQRLGGMTQLGQASAAGVGSAGIQTGNNVTQLLQQQGAAQAGASIAQGKAYGQMASGISGAFGQFVGAKF